nr:hypothetical protein I308_03958 [Cryptococcus tetragattii IND107]
MKTEAGHQLSGLSSTEHMFVPLLSLPHVEFSAGV